MILTVLASSDVNNAYQIGNLSSDTVTIADAPAPAATSTPAAPTPSRTTTPTATATPGATAADHFMAYAVAITKDTDKFLPLGPLTSPTASVAPATTLQSSAHCSPPPTRTAEVGSIRIRISSSIA